MWWCFISLNGYVIMEMIVCFVVLLKHGTVHAHILMTWCICFTLFMYKMSWSRTLFDARATCTFPSMTVYLTLFSFWSVIIGMDFECMEYLLPFCGRYSGKTFAELECKMIHWDDAKRKIIILIEFKQMLNIVHGMSCCAQTLVQQLCYLFLYFFLRPDNSTHCAYWISDKASGANPLDPLVFCGSSLFEDWQW